MEWRRLHVELARLKNAVNRYVIAQTEARGPATSLL